MPCAICQVKWFHRMNVLDVVKGAWHAPLRIDAWLFLNSAANGAFV
jgi:hypothetical protein